MGVPSLSPLSSIDSSSIKYIHKKINTLKHKNYFYRNILLYKKYLSFAPAKFAANSKHYHNRKYEGYFLKGQSF